MICFSCGSNRMYQLPPSGPMTPEVTLPQVCMSCGHIEIDGDHTSFPQEIEQQTVTLAEAASKSAEAAAGELEKDPRRQIEGYMANFYSKAYLDGFFRALAFFRHQAREGRIRRLRELWQSARVDIPPGSSDVVVRIDGDAYTEFDRLLNLATGKEHAPSSSHQRPPVSKGDAHVP